MTLTRSKWGRMNQARAGRSGEPGFESWPGPSEDSDTCLPGWREMQ